MSGYKNYTSDISANLINQHAQRKRQKIRLLTSHKERHILSYSEKICYENSRNLMKKNMQKPNLFSLKYKLPNNKGKFASVFSSNKSVNDNSKESLPFIKEKKMNSKAPENLVLISKRAKMRLSHNNSIEHRNDRSSSKERNDYIPIRKYNNTTIKIRPIPMNLLSQDSNSTEPCKIDKRNIVDRLYRGLNIKHKVMKLNFDMNNNTVNTKPAKKKVKKIEKSNTEIVQNTSESSRRSTKREKLFEIINKYFMKDQLRFIKDKPVIRLQQGKMVEFRRTFKKIEMIDNYKSDISPLEKNVQKQLFNLKRAKALGDDAKIKGKVISSSNFFNLKFGDL